MKFDDECQGLVYGIYEDENSGYHYGVLLGHDTYNFNEIGSGSRSSTDAFFKTLSC